MLCIFIFDAVGTQACSFLVSSCRERCNYNPSSSRNDYEEQLSNGDLLALPPAGIVIKSTDGTEAIFGQARVNPTKEGEVPHLADFIDPALNKLNRIINNVAEQQGQ